VGDFNGDSDPDLAVVNGGDPFGGGISVLLGGAGGSFAAPASFAAGDAPSAVAVGDFNGDSDPDLAVANWGDPSSGLDGGVSVLLGEAGGSFAAPANFAAGEIPVEIAVGDFDGDADPDLAVANEPELALGIRPGVSVLLNNRPPVAGADGYAMDEDTRLTVAAPGVLGNDRDDGALTAAEVSGPAHGSLTVNRDGSFSYRPDPGFSGTDSFSYQAGDGSLHTDPATVTIEVRPRAGAAPAGGRAAPAEQALAGLRLGSRCVRRSRSGQVRIPMTLRLARPGPVQVRIDRAVRTKAKRSCPKPNRYAGRLRTLATLRRLSTRPAAAGRRQLTLELRLAPGLYRLTVRARLDGNRLSAPARRYLHVLASRRSGGS
jgi:Bacterial Ig domain/FG-GAP-like repeat